MKSHYSCAELARLKLPGYPATKKGWIDKVERDGWSKQKRAGRGGGYEYQPSADILKAIKDQSIKQLIGSTNENSAIDAISRPTESAKIVSPTASKALVVKAGQSTDLKDWQRSTAEARAAICQEVKRLAEVGGVERAIKLVIEMYEAGTLAPHLATLVPVANAKGRGLSRPSIKRWMKDAEHGITSLAPKARESHAVPAWVAYFLPIWSVPTGITLKDALAQLAEQLPVSINMPSYWQAKRFLDKMGKVERERGRKGTRELRNIQPFIRRDTSTMWPGDAYTADGHTFDAEIAHRDHGRPMRPEVTLVLDIATRKCVGWSVDLAESTWSVLDALRHAVTSHGIPSIFYVDNGSGFKNQAMSHEATGFMARLGITLTHSLPYRSQARGIIERAHQTILVKAAKKLPTYMGKDMDPEARGKVFKLTRKDVKATGQSRYLMPWSDFISWLEEQINLYNEQSHTALPRIKDQITGNYRHQSPTEAWAAAAAEGWKPELVSEAEADDLFRPYKEVKTNRGEVRLFNNLYFDHSLEEYHGEKVRVGFDIHDGSKVWVRDQQGRLICVAGFEANKRSYFPQSMLEAAHETRAKGRLRRVDAKRDEILEELEGSSLLLEHQPVIELPRMAINTPEAVVATPYEQPEKLDVQAVETGQGNVVEMPKKAVQRPMFDTDASKFRWLMKHPDQMHLDDESWLGWYRTTSEYEDLFGEEMAAR